jgi:hypothetical protein
MTRSILHMEPSELEDQVFVLDHLLEAGEHVAGRIQMWEMPEAHREYVLGTDCAYGIPGRDYDAGIVLDHTSFVESGVCRQVGEIHGHWGPVFDRVLYATLRFFNDAFFVCERQVGLFHLSRLWNEYHYRWIYYQRDPRKPARPTLQVLGENKLGHHAAAGDDILRNLRLGVRQKQLELRSSALIEQMGKLQFRGPDREVTKGEREPDTMLRPKLIGGGSPDLVMGCAYAWHGIREVQHYDKPDPGYPEESLGEILGHDVLDKDPNEGRGPTWGLVKKKRV